MGRTRPRKHPSLLYSWTGRVSARHAAGWLGDSHRGSARHGRLTRSPTRPVSTPTTAKPSPARLKRATLRGTSVAESKRHVNFLLAIQLDRACSTHSPARPPARYRLTTATPSPTHLTRSSGVTAASSSSRREARPFCHARTLRRGAPDTSTNSAEWLVSANAIRNCTVFSHYRFVLPHPT